jgi:hypothetical protein
MKDYKLFKINYIFTNFQRICIKKETQKVTNLIGYDIYNGFNYNHCFFYEG